MSGSEEHNPPLANADDDHEPDLSQQATMEQMMGFGSFSGPQKPKRQPRVPGAGKGFGTGANTQPIQPRTTSASTQPSKGLSATSHPFVPASLPPRSAKQNSKSPTPDSLDPSSSIPTVHEAPGSDEVGYTNPITGYTLTKRELLAYEKGVMQQVTDIDGNAGQVKVYFKPNFIENNPWEQLEVKTGLKEVN